MWGSNKDAFMTTSDENKENNVLKEFTKVEKFTANITNEINKNDGTYTEGFINCNLVILIIKSKKDVQYQIQSNYSRKL